MAKTYHQEGKVLDYQNGGTPIASGAMVRIGSRLGVAVDDIAANAIGPVHISDVWILPKVTANVVAVGDMLNFDASAALLTSAATAAAGDLTGAAMAVEAADGTTSEVAVLLGNFGTPS